MRRLALAGVLALAGCAYYNGLYNANQLASDARRAEREGRTGEARSLWSRAAVKAESVAARFPKSKWRDDALLLQGRALLQVDACTRAVEPLQLAVDSSTDRTLRHRARLLLAQCRQFMREPEAARATLDPVVRDADSTLRDEALWRRGRAQLTLGRTAEALEDLERSRRPEAAYPRAIAYALLERGADAVATLGPEAGRRPFDEPRWTGALDTVGAVHPVGTSELVTALVDRPDLTDGQRARLLIADAERWLAVPDTARATARLERAERVAPDSLEARVARTYLALRDLRRERDPAALPVLFERIQQAVRAGGRPTQLAGRPLSVLGRLVPALTAPEPDPLHLFLGAEDLRDSLGLADLAAALFLDVAARWPESVLAPKALIAALPLRPALHDSVLTVLEARYAASVYTRALRGEDVERYQVVEDSLRQAARAAGRGGLP